MRKKTGFVAGLGLSGSTMAFAIMALTMTTATPASAEECLLDDGDPGFEGVVDDALFVVPADSTGGATFTAATRAW